MKYLFLLLVLVGCQNRETSDFPFQKYSSNPERYVIAYEENKSDDGNIHLTNETIKVFDKFTTGDNLVFKKETQDIEQWQK